MARTVTVSVDVSSLLEAAKRGAKFERCRVRQLLAAEKVRHEDVLAALDVGLPLGPIALRQRGKARAVVRALTRLEEALDG